MIYLISLRRVSPGVYRANPDMHRVTDVLYESCWNLRIPAEDAMRVDHAQELRSDKTGRRETPGQVAELSEGQACWARMPQNFPALRAGISPENRVKGPTFSGRYARLYARAGTTARPVNEAYSISFNS